ncbi:hypothetical protein E4K10_20665 [Streptomyces sp. T1317-0309]|nr:hypothetical protein E4K10_20665 [Streptomyces sp. T1317-0309]
MLGHGTDGGFVVDEVQSGVTTVPRLSAGRLGLLGAGDGGSGCPTTCTAATRWASRPSCRPTTMSPS